MTPEEQIKSVAPVSRAILPDTASPIERALLCVELAALAEIDVSLISKIWDPWEVDKILLPWLAWALSVDVWDDTWDEIVKRRVIATSPMVHRLKGTRFAVENALQAMGYDAKITEWWEQEPVGRRGTFKVDVFFSSASDKLRDDAENLAFSSISASKPKTRVFELRKIMKSEATQFMGAYGLSGGLHVGGILVEQPNQLINQFIAVYGLSGGRHQGGLENTT